MVRVEEATKMGRVPSRPSTGEASRLSFGHSKNISLWNHHVPSRRISRYSLYLKVPFLLSPPSVLVNMSSGILTIFHAF